MVLLIEQFLLSYCDVQVDIKEISVVNNKLKIVFRKNINDIIFTCKNEDVAKQYFNKIKKYETTGTGLFKYFTKCVC